MEDRRIRKTKKSLKETLIRMLDSQAFEQISVTELCRLAEISRITFYSHYDDKYALADDLFNDMLEIGTRDYRRRQQENNPQGSLVAGYVNMLGSILDLYYDRIDFFRHTDPDRNPYLAIRFYTIVVETVELHTSRLPGKLKVRLRYSPKKIAGFVCYGMLGFLNAAHEEKTSLEEIRKEAEELLTDILRSDVLTEQR